MMRKKTYLVQIPFVFSEASDTLNQEGEPVLTMELHWPEGDDGCPKKLARLLALSASVWAARWRGVLYPRACAALAAWLATGMEVDLLRKCFGGFLVLVGVTELFGKDQEK